VKSGPEAGTDGGGRPFLLTKPCALAMDEGEGAFMTQVSRLCALVLAPYRPVHLYTRAHIDLQRVAGALCCS
jgi:hypothetical protein